MPSCELLATSPQRIQNNIGFVCLFVCLSFFIFVFWDRVSPCSPGCPETHSADQAGLGLRGPPASRGLGLEVCATTSGNIDYYYSGWLPTRAARLLSTWHNWSHEGKGTLKEKLSLSGWPAGKSVGHCLDDWWLIWEDLGHLRWCQPWSGGPRLCKNAGWACHGEQASKQPSAVVSASVPASGLLPGAPVLAPLNDKL